jgi:hypothetical protein
MSRVRETSRFYCFSPPVMLATFIIEVAYISYIVVRYKLNLLSRLAVAILFLLAVFQLSEYFVCGGLGTGAATWSKIGFAAITLLAPVGMHFVYAIAGKKWNNIIGAAYGMGVAWIVLFAFSEAIFRNHVCAGNYVIFSLKPGFGGLFFAYYYFWLILGTLISLYFINRVDKAKRLGLSIFIFGYLSLMLPTAIVNNLKPETILGLPSVMCGFAIILATVVTLGIIPQLGEPKNSPKK